MNQRLFALAALGLTFWTASAADEPKVNVLTPQEIADGWILLFDGDTTFGWQTKGNVKVDKGMLVVGGEEAASVQTTTAFGPCSLAFELRVEGKEKAAVTMHEAPLAAGQRGEAWVRYQAKIVGGRLDLRSEGDGTGAAQVGPLKVERASPLSVSTPAGVKAQLRNVKLRPFGVKSIFNDKDKDLTGWREHPNKKSKFSVEDETIRIKDGPGDLQSEGEWDDFVLQLECKTNGKHLNSGVFFRCRPKEYQNGYEAQIQNGFGPDKEYAIETYDPESGKVIDTKKEKFAAMDYGTGAIYRRMPARKQLAKDGEWFTMTVVAQGRHIATWVNGVQAVDWTDTRKPSDNARTGYRAEKGHISFQGHDPTTDLNFRNIRIGELPK